MLTMTKREAYVPAFSPRQVRALVGAVSLGDRVSNLVWTALVVGGAVVGYIVSGSILGAIGGAVVIPVAIYFIGSLVSGETTL